MNESDPREERLNKPAALNAGIASQLAIGRHWPGLEKGQPVDSRRRVRMMVLEIGLLLLCHTG
jgi:hypothetical protein